VSKPIRILPEDDAIREEWTRDVDDARIVTASRFRRDNDWPWQVCVPAAEFLRDKPLEHELNESVLHALLGVRGVSAAHHEDREVWVVSGRPRGKALVAAAGGAVDGLADRIRAAF
jgi:hypothetical protein